MPGGFPQTNPWKYYRGLAFSKAATQTLKQEYLGYPNWLGNPAPSMLAWFPRLTNGTFTGQGQAGWTISGNDDYVVIGGEFPRAGGVDQQGLTRFAKRSLAPNRSGLSSPSKSNPQVTSPAPGQALVTWQTNWDRDNANLTYTVIRNGNLVTPADTVTAESRYWDRPYLSFLDTIRPRTCFAGQSVRYRIFATDPLGNESRSDTVNVTLAESGTVDDYSRAVISDGPMHFWRFNEGSGTTAADYTGRDNLTTTGAVTRGVSGAIAGDSAATFPGTAAPRRTTARRRRSLLVQRRGMVPDHDQPRWQDRRLRQRPDRGQRQPPPTTGTSTWATTAGSTSGCGPTRSNRIVTSPSPTTTGTGTMWSALSATAA